jgi:3-oxoacyl-[acyl-carrier protein] reductase
MAQLSVDLSGQTAIITGAGLGLGRAAALGLARSGARLILNDINPDKLDETLELIQAEGGQAVAFQGDISNRFQASALIERGRDAYGRIHLLVNGAGVYKADALLSADEWDIRRQVEVNIVGAFFMTQLVARVMKDEGGGTIINLSASVGHGGSLEAGAGYVASKAAVLGLTRQSARELAAHGIRVNALCVAHLGEPDMLAIPPANLLGQRGTPEDAVGALLFLASDAARFVVGQALHVDGGDWLG